MQQASFGRRGVMEPASVPSFRERRAYAAVSAGAIGDADPTVEYDTAGDDAISLVEMSRFVGPNWHKYEDAFDNWSAGLHGFSWCWSAFFLAPAWMLYRKMYMECGLLILCIAVLNFVFGKVGTAMSVIMATQAKPIYFMFAQRKILAIRKLRLSPSETVQKISDTGEVSIVVGVISGVLMIFAILAVLASIVR